MRKNGVIARIRARRDVDMVDKPLARPDITITLDDDGVIRDAVSSSALEEESLDDWRGRPWGDTIERNGAIEFSKMIEAVRLSGDSTCLQVRQRFPSGRELPIEYTTISLGNRGGFIAIGKNLETIADLQSRLMAAQQAREQDYWKLREIETRYRLVFDASTEAVALVRMSNLRVVEANLAASKALGLLPGAEFLPDMPARSRKAFESLLERVREHGRAPGIALQLNDSAAAWSLRASIVTTQSDTFYLLQMSPMGGAPMSRDSRGGTPSIEDIVQRLPDGFAIVDREGVIRRANNTFLDLAQVGAESAVIGQKMKRWLSRPGADMTVILALIQRHGGVRMMATVIEGELGSQTELEISAVGDNNSAPEYIGLLMRDVTMRSRVEAPLGASVPETDAEVMSLEALVKASTEAIERSTITKALDRFHGHRTAAAKYLGLSRQSLHAKLKKYGFEDL